MTGTGTLLPLRHSSLLLFIADALVGEAGKQTGAIIERSRRVSTSTVSVNGNGWGSEWHNVVMLTYYYLLGRFLCERRFVCRYW